MQALVHAHCARALPVQTTCKSLPCVPAPNHSPLGERKKRNSLEPQTPARERWQEANVQSKTEIFRLLSQTMFFAVLTQLSSAIQLSGVVSVTRMYWFTLTTEVGEHPPRELSSCLFVEPGKFSESRSEKENSCWPETSVLLLSHSGWTEPKEVDAPVWIVSHDKYLNLCQTVACCPCCC